MAPRVPVRILDYADKAKAYPRELMLNFSTGALHAKAADGTEITIIKPIKVADAAGNEFGSVLANVGGTVTIPDATDSKTGLLTATDHDLYTKHISTAASDTVSGHIKLAGATDVPVAGTENGAVGTSALAARADHSHPTPTKVASSTAADKLAAERTITLTGGATGSAKFDGSKDIEIAVTVAKPAAATTADKLATERTITLTGGATGSVTFDGSKDVTINVTVAKPASASAADTATQLTTARGIDGVNFNGTADISHYGTCSTAAATAAKVVALTGYKLVTGGTVRVKFTITNTATNPTLNVNSTGAKAIYYRGAAITASYLGANRVYEFVYDGTNYELVGDINVDTNTTYTASSSTPAAATTSGTVGTSTAYARADHAHPAQTTITGNAGTATKLATARTISLTGAVTGSGSFDGSGNLSIATSKGTVASATTYTATIGTSWTGSSAPYTQTITVSGILSTDNPIVDCVLSTTYSTAKSQLEAYSNIYQITTATNSITVRATAKTTTSVPIQLLCIR